MTKYMAKPAKHAQAVLLAIRGGTRMMYKRSKNSEEKPYLIPELFDRLCEFGREMRRGDVASKHL